MATHLTRSELQKWDVCEKTTNDSRSVWAPVIFPHFLAARCLWADCCAFLVCVCNRKETLSGRWRRFVVSWRTISAPTPSGEDRDCSRGSLRPGELVCGCLLRDMGCTHEVPCVAILASMSVCQQCVIICCPFGSHGKICSRLFVSSRSYTQLEFKSVLLSESCSFFKLCNFLHSGCYTEGGLICGGFLSRFAINQVLTVRHSCDFCSLCISAASSFSSHLHYAENAHFQRPQSKEGSYPDWILIYTQLGCTICK